MFVYEKVDDPFARTGRLNMMHMIFVDKGRTADVQTTRGLRQIIANEGNADDIVAFLQDRNLPVDEIEARNITETMWLNRRCKVTSLSQTHCNGGCSTVG